MNGIGLDRQTSQVEKQEFSSVNSVCYGNQQHQNTEVTGNPRPRFENQQSRNIRGAGEQNRVKETCGNWWDIPSF